MRCVRLLFIAIYLLSSFAEALTCKNLLTPSIELYSLPSNSPRLEIIKMSNDEAYSKLFIEESNFSQNTESAVIEMIRMLALNSHFKLEDKNVLTKNKFTLGLHSSEGYVFELTYESKSNLNPRFVLQDKIVLITPSGKDFKVTDNLISRDELKIINSEFDLKDFAPMGRHLKLKVPLVIDGELLKKFSHLAEYFEYFEKDELAQIFKSNNMLKIETLFKIRKAKKVFINQVIKGPFKFIISGVLAFSVFNSHLIVPDHSANQPLLQNQTISAPYVAKTINNLPIPNNQIELKKEYHAFQAEISEKLALKKYSSTAFFDIKLDVNNRFSQENNIFIYKKYNDNIGLAQTYAVFAKDISQNQVLGMQYLVVEISADKYKNLINYIDNQGLISTKTGSVISE